MFKKLLISLALLAGVHTLNAQGVPSGSSGAPAPDCYFSSGSAPTSAVGSYGPNGGLNGSYDNTRMGCTFWHLIYAATSNASSISIELDGAPAGTTLGAIGTYAALAGVAPGSSNPSTATVGGEIAVFATTPPAFLQVKFGTLNAGTVTWQAVGYRPNITTTTQGFGQLITGTCNQTVAVAVTAGNTTRLITAVSGQSIRICGAVIALATTGTAEITSGTGSGCSSATTLTGTMDINKGTPLTIGGGLGPIAIAAAGKDLCIAAVTGNATGVLSYAIF